MYRIYVLITWRVCMWIGTAKPHKICILTIHWDAHEKWGQVTTANFSAACQIFVFFSHHINTKRHWQASFMLWWVNQSLTQVSKQKVQNVPPPGAETGRCTHSSFSLGRASIALGKTIRLLKFRSLEWDRERHGESELFSCMTAKQLHPSKDH